MNFRNPELKGQHRLAQSRPCNCRQTCNRDLVQKGSQNFYDICTLENALFPRKAKLKLTLKIKSHQLYYTTGLQQGRWWALRHCSKDIHFTFKVINLKQTKSFPLPSSCLYFLYTSTPSPTLNPLVRDDCCLKYFKQIPCSSSDLVCADFAAAWSTIYRGD